MKRNRFITQLVLGAFAILAIAPASRAAEVAKAKECEFTPRSQIAELLSAMPDDVVGWVNCERHPDASVFIVMKVKALTEQSLEAKVLAFAKSTDARTETESIVWKSKQALEQRQLTVETHSKKEDAGMSHYAFVGEMDHDNVYVFVHSMNEREAHLIHNTLDHIHTLVSRPEFLTNMWASEQAHKVARKAASETPSSNN